MNQITAAAMARTPPPLTRWLDRAVPAGSAQTFLQELHALLSADQARGKLARTWSKLPQRCWARSP